MKIDVCCGYASEVRCLTCGGANRSELTGLQKRQQFRLQRQGEFADFIEKQCSTVGGAHKAFMACIRAGEGAFLVTKQLGLEQRACQRCTIYLDKWTGTTVAFGVCNAS